MKKVIVLGGGFAGVSATKELLKHIPPDYSVTLVSKSSRFLFKPLLHEVATGAFADEIVCEDIEAAFRHSRFSFVNGTAAAANLKRKFVVVAGKKLSYDYLLIALGSEPNFFGIPGAAGNSLPVGSVKDALSIKKALVSIAGKEKPRIIIVGGGALGIELSAEIAGLMGQLNKNRFILVVNREHELLPGISEHARNKIELALLRRRVHLLQGTAVSRVSKGFIITGKKEKISSDLIIWAAGVKPALIKITPKIDILRGCLPVDGFLRLSGFSNVFVAGDCAAFRAGNSFVPQLAKSAVQEGRAAARNILAAISGRQLKAFAFNDNGFVIPLGKGHAIGQIKGIAISGFFTWWVNRTVYMLHMLTLKHKLFVVWKWTLGLFQKRNTK